MKKLFYRQLEKFLGANLWFISIFLDNRLGKDLFLKKFLLNRPHLLEAYYQQKPASKRAKTILILKPDAIGDYILFRNFLEIICRSEKYRGFSFLLVGNLLWKDLAEFWDKDMIQVFRFMNRREFLNGRDTRYKYEFLYDLNQFKVHSLIYFVHSREPMAGDWLVKHIPAAHKISSSGDLQCQKPDERSEGNSVYTRLIDTGSVQNFELEKHKQFTSELVGSSENDFQFRLPSVPDFSFKSQRPYVVFFPGAGAALRQWSPENFALVLDFILAETRFDVLIAGSEGERTLGETISGKPSERVQNLCGKTSLPELVGMIKNARLLISNESSAVHMAAFSGVETLCLSNGNHYGRFNPYQNQGLPFVKTLYPESIHRLPEAERIKLYYEGSTLPIQEISVDQVIEALKQTRAFGS